jgi:hypothetical protein
MRTGAQKLSAQPEAPPAECLCWRWKTPGAQQEMRTSVIGKLLTAHQCAVLFSLRALKGFRWNTQGFPTALLPQA